MTDPTQVHSGTCDHCEREVNDGEQALYAWGRLMVCTECYDILSDEADEEARQEEAEHDLKALSASVQSIGNRNWKADTLALRDAVDRDSWLFVASDIALAPFGGSRGV